MQSQYFMKRSESSTLNQNLTGGLTPFKLITASSHKMQKQIKTWLLIFSLSSMDKGVSKMSLRNIKGNETECYIFSQCILNHTDPIALK